MTILTQNLLYEPERFLIEATGADRWIVSHMPSGKCFRVEKRAPHGTIEVRDEQSRGALVVYNAGACSCWDGPACMHLAIGRALACFCEDRRLRFEAEVAAEEPLEPEGEPDSDDLPDAVWNDDPAYVDPFVEQVAL